MDSPSRTAPSALATAASRQGLSPSAPAFTPPQKPHTLQIFAPNCTLTMPCDLATLQLSSVYAFVQEEMALESGTFELRHSGIALNDSGAKAIDVGLSNKSSLTLHNKGQLSSPAKEPHTFCMTTMPPLQNDVSGEMNHMEAMLAAQLAQYNAAIAANQMQQLQLAAAAGLPLPQIQNSPPMLPVNNKAGFFGSQSPPGVRAGSRSPNSTSHNRPTGCVNLSAIASDEFSTFALTSEGSRALQAALRSSADTAATVQQVLEDLRPRFVGLATHRYGSEVVRTLVEVATPEQKSELLLMACSDLVELAESSSGCDVLLLLVEAVPETSPEAQHLVACMAAGVVPIMNSVSGRKLVVKALTKYPAEVIEPFFDAVGANLLTLAVDHRGCITVQRCLDLAVSVKLKTQLQVQILEITPHLITDPYGNYVLQNAIRDEPYCSQVVAHKIAPQLLVFATNKFASNVLERCLQIGPDDVREVLITQICDVKLMEVLMQDAYGNFVVQSAVDNAPHSLLQTLKDAIVPHVAKSPYGYRIETKLQRRMKRSRMMRSKDSPDSNGFGRVSSTSPLGSMGGSPPLATAFQGGLRVPITTPDLFANMSFPVPQPAPQVP